MSEQWAVLVDGRQVRGDLPTEARAALHARSWAADHAVVEVRPVGKNREMRAATQRWEHGQKARS